MTLITDYEEEECVRGGFKIITYTIGSLYFEEIRCLEGSLLLFKCTYGSKNIITFRPAISNNYFRLICEVTGIDA